MEKILLSTRWKPFIWLILPILIGVAVVVIAPIMKSGPQKVETAERPVKVRAIKVSLIDVVPGVVGYGQVAPARTWDAVAEVAGQVIWIADELRDGQVVVAGTGLLQLDDSNYRLALAEADAQLRAADLKIKTARDGLAIARKESELLRSEYERKKELAQKGTISKAALEASERTMLAGQARATNLRNTLDLTTAEHQVRIAQRDAADLDLERTHKTAPFDVRITTVNIGLAQYANRGQPLFSADGLDVAEVTAQFPIGILRPLVSVSGKGSEAGVRQGALALKAVVRLRTATHTVEWPARVSRVTGTIDVKTQSLGVVVAVDRPLEVARPGERPPLYRNTFVEVELTAAPVKDQIVVPLSAIHQGTIYMINADSRLEIRKVEIKFSQKGYAVLKKGINAGDQIVTSDLTFAVKGMLLTPQEDKQTKRRMIAEATAREPGN